MGRESFFHLSSDDGRLDCDAGRMSVPAGRAEVPLPFEDPHGLLAQLAATPLIADIRGLAPDAPVLQGFLKKLAAPAGGSGGAGAEAAGAEREGKRRWFVLTREALAWRKGQQPAPGEAAAGAAGASSGRVLLRDIVGLFDGAQGQAQAQAAPNSFVLRTRGGRALALQAPLEAAKRHWLTAVAGAIVCLQQQQQQQQQLAAAGAGASAGAGSSAGTNAPVAPAPAPEAAAPAGTAAPPAAPASARRETLPPAATSAISTTAAK